MNRIHLGVGAALAAIGSLAVVPTAPATATVYDRLEAVDEAISYTYGDCGPTFAVEGVFNGRLILRRGTGPETGTFPVLDRFSVDETHTNTLTGKSFSVRADGIHNEVKARQVEGSVFEFRVIEAGQPMVVEDADGNVVLRDRGAVRYTFLFDTAGDLEPGGSYLTDWMPIEPHAPRPSWDVDWCELALSLTAGP